MDNDVNLLRKVLPKKKFTKERNFLRRKIKKRKDRNRKVFMYNDYVYHVIKIRDMLQILYRVLKAGNITFRYFLNEYFPKSICLSI